MVNAVLVFLAGGAGVLSRYAIQVLVKHNSIAGFPIITLAINVIGCLLMGIAIGAFSKTLVEYPIAMVPITVGFLGGFTTFSTYAFELHQLFTQGHWHIAITYVLLSNILGVITFAIGYMVAIR